MESRKPAHHAPSSPAEAEDKPVPGHCYNALYGVDSLWLRAEVALTPAARSEIAEATRIAYARSKGEVSIGSATWNIDRSSGANGTERFALTLMTERLGRVGIKLSRSKTEAEVLIRFHARPLWHAGPTKLVEIARAWLGKLGRTHHVRVTRIDLAADFIGWFPEPKHDDTFVGRGSKDTYPRKSTIYFSEGERSHIKGRLYNKSRQVEHKGIDWYEGLLKPEDREHTKHRLEFTLDGHALRARPFLRSDHPDKVLASLHALWVSCVGPGDEQNGWLRQVTRSGKNLTPIWKAVRKAFREDGSTTEPLAPLPRQAGKSYRTRVNRSVVGWLSSLDAIIRGDSGRPHDRARLLAEVGKLLDDEGPEAFESAVREKARKQGITLAP